MGGSGTPLAPAPGICPALKKLLAPGRVQHTIWLGCLAAPGALDTVRRACPGLTWCPGAHDVHPGPPTRVLALPGTALRVATCHAPLLDTTPQALLLLSSALACHVLLTHGAAPDTPAPAHGPRVQHHASCLYLSPGVCDAGAARASFLLLDLAPDAPPGAPTLTVFVYEHAADTLHVQRHDFAWHAPAWHALPTP